MKSRTKEFAKEIIRLCRKLPENREGRLIGNQLFRSGTSVAANYRSACRARSKAEFVSRLAIVEEEADETFFWLELIKEMKPEIQNLKSTIQIPNSKIQIPKSKIGDPNSEGAVL